MMPHTELKYSNDLTLDTEAIFTAIEWCINQKDPSAGVCKSRAYPASEYQHTHVYISVSLLNKPHRDGAFSQSLLEVLNSEIKSLLIQDCYFSLELNYVSDYYLTDYFKSEYSQIN
ncbi:hypothetical protein [Shewanella surugensis]|uniref:5-carboxymethyl-2-hydroxymuconate Delta-isomerase n=1 Tax=Shewanella surugensis TaxID=212020 RepID=A0ABT0LET1_9GAMM|nr:hypothetical protein [Shewanella surugensis]MCL1126170.1 hypothetical protein [Shewanella surugensis]